MKAPKGIIDLACIRAPLAHGETKYPDHSHFYVAVRSACSNLDFKQLAELARERRS